jgi:hypothetical protein
MKAREKLCLGLGDEVLWIDPEGTGDSSPYEIVDILTPDQKIEDLDTVVVIKNKQGIVNEAYVAELG